MPRKNHALNLAIAAVLAAISPVSAADAPGHPRFGTWGVDLGGMNKGQKPGDDFFMYANGAWYNAAVIPPDRAGTGSFLDLRILSEQRMSELAETLKSKPRDQLTTDEKKLRDLYEAYTDQAAIEARGLAPAKKDLNQIAGLKTRDDIARIMGSVRLATGGPFSIYVSVNNKNSNQYMLRLRHAGLGMPNRDYYLRDDKDLATTREAYKKYLASVFALLGTPDPATHAQAVYEVEQKIAEAHWINADRRDSDKTFNPMSFTELTQLAPQFPWKSYFAAGEIPTTEAGSRPRQLIVAEKSAFPKLAQIFAETPVSVWRDYLTVRYVHAYAAVLPKAFDDADFAFYGAVIQGNAQQLPRDVRAVHLLDDLLGESFAKLYVAKYFPPEAREKAQRLVDNLLKVYDADIRVLPWMTPETRQKALDKLHTFAPHIGYPERWRDYSAYAVTRDDVLGDVQRGAEVEWKRNLKRIDEAVDKNEWGMTPPTVNAYYTQSFNAIFFPASILQPPFFDPNADDAVNYGGIGAVIGHEISHGFDDQGSKYDGAGALNNWWTEADRAAFEGRTTVLRQQYDSYEPLPGMHVNGAFTMGENIADLSGLTIALKAYHLSLGGKPAPVIEGYSGDQRFFLGYGQIWREKQRDGRLRERVLSDPHSPSNFRAIGATRNMDEWYNAFGVGPQDKYYIAPADRVRLW